MKKIAFVYACLFLFSCVNSSIKEVDEKQEFDSNNVSISGQVWMSKNLNVDRFRNGDLIYHAKTCYEWIEAWQTQRPAYCYLYNNEGNGEVLGKLYNWYAVNDFRGLAPYGWHIPTDAEWTELINNLGGENNAGTKMKCTRGWYQNGNTNSSGFSALPGGMRDNSGHFTRCDLDDANWWSSTETSKVREGDEHIRYLIDVYTRHMFSSDSTVSRGSFLKGYGLSVRCIKN